MCTFTSRSLPGSHIPVGLHGLFLGVVACVKENKEEDLMKNTYYYLFYIAHIDFGIRI